MISVAPSQLIPVFYSWAGSYERSFPEVADAICHASNVDPIFRGENLGACATACILVAEAYERSKFEPYMVRENGRRLGILQLPRPSRPNIGVDTLVRPKMNCLVGVDLIRRSFENCHKLKWEARLAWLHSLGKPGALGKPMGGGWDDPPLEALRPEDQGLMMSSWTTLMRAKKLFDQLYAKKGVMPTEAKPRETEAPALPAPTTEPEKDQSP